LSLLGKAGAGKKYEKQIDQIVYELYSLTEDEIAIVDGKFS